MNNDTNNDKRGAEGAAGVEHEYNITDITML